MGISEYPKEKPNLSIRGFLAGLPRSPLICFLFRSYGLLPYHRSPEVCGLLIFCASSAFHLHLFLWTFLALRSSWWVFGALLFIGFFSVWAFGHGFKKWATTPLKWLVLLLIWICSVGWKLIVKVRCSIPHQCRGHLFFPLPFGICGSIEMEWYSIIISWM